MSTYAISPALRAVAKQVERHLLEIEPLFKPEVKLTFLARFPGDDERGILLSCDDLNEVAKAIERAGHREELT